MKSKMLRKTAIATAIGASMVIGGSIWAQEAYNPAIELQTTISDGFTYAVVGDIIAPLPTSQFPDPAFQSALKILRGADVAYGNFKVSAINIAEFQGPSGGLLAVPQLVPDVKAMGFKAVGRSNSDHLFDFYENGMLETNDRLEKADIVYAGSGKNYGAARAPRYLMTDKGRVAFVAAATSTIPTAPPGKGRSNVFAPMRALPADGEMPGRPGGSMIAVTPIFVVPKSLANSLEAVKKGFPTGGGLYAPQNDTAERFQILEQNFRYADTERARYTYEVNKSDVDAILHAVKEGKQKSDFLSFGLDSPDVTYLEKPDTDPTPADFLQGLAHQVIDAGADTFVGTGVHVLRGIEIYKGRPIFYGLGAFLRQIDIARVDVSFPERGTIDSDPTKYESVIAVNRYAGGRLSEVRLYPLQLGEDKRMAERGLPRVATPEAAQRILKRLQEVSAPFSTQIVIENNIGIIRVSKSN